MELGIQIATGIALVLFLFSNCCIVQVHCVPYSRVDSRPHLTLYEHENHQGKRYHQDVGRRCYNVPGVFEGRASSLSTHHKCVKVCSRRNCRKCVKMAPGTKGHFALREIGFNDAISSFTVC